MRRETGHISQRWQRAGSTHQRDEGQALLSYPYLYGSHARGDATSASDYDLLAIRKSGDRILRDARKWRGVYIDLFVYPERRVRPSSLLHVKGGKVLLQRQKYGDQLLLKLDRVHARGPQPLPLDELAARKVWARKMLDRVRIGGLEGQYRRAWLLTALLEDYFAFRGLWYEGPKTSLQWLQHNEPDIHARFAQALRPNASIVALEALVRAVAK